MKYLRPLVVCSAAALLAGCLNSTTVINVKADGSGTIEQTLLVNKQAMAQVQQMTGGRGGAAKKGGLFDEQSMRNAASSLGDGVAFVSATPIDTTDTEGTRAIYAFSDITKLRMNQKPSAPGGEAAGMAVPGGSAPEDLLFRFAKSPAGNPRVTVVFPESKMDEARKGAQAQQGQAGAQAPKAGDPMQAAMLAMVKPMLNGARISIVLQPDGRIVKTNSPFVQGQQVTLFEMDLAQLLADETILQKIQGAASFEDVKAMLKGVKGAKVNPDREVSVEFAARKAPTMPLPIPKR
jgi:hypothetical protein